jgi:hypothetical protein
MSAPFGNQNAAKAKRWTAAIDRALERRAGVSLRTAQQELDDLADKFLTAVETGQSDFLPGFRELGDRLEGKAAQSVAVTGEDGGPVELGFKVVLGQ